MTIDGDVAAPPGGTRGAGARIDVRDLVLRYAPADDDAPFTALDGVSLSVARGEFVTVIGASGCGKTSLLLAVAGLVPIAGGAVEVGGRPVSGPGPDRALVFQDASLLPWRTVLENVRFGLELGRWPGDRDRRAMQFVDLVGLGDAAARRPHQLSGGMRQRANIARALAVDPAVLLMDEPFGALDAQTREVLGEELLTIWDRDRKTALFVTHDIDEAILLGDRVVAMGGAPGRVREVLSIELPRPRHAEMMETPEFAAYRRRLRAHLADDMAALRLARAR